MPSVVREAYATAGYDRSWRPEPEALTVRTDLCLGPLNEGEAEFRRLSDDQSIVTGYAVDLPGTNYLPPEHWLAVRLAARFWQLRGKRPELKLGPDGKVIVLVESENGSSRMTGFSTSLQHAADADAIGIHRAALELLGEQLAEAEKAIPGFEPLPPETVVVNGAGDFVVGGPEGDNGLSGKKLVLDAYGPRVAIGGGALSGKDFFKADRAGAILARRLAKAVVMTGAARECRAVLAFLPGAGEARIVSLVNERGDVLDAGRWSRLMDLSLAAVGQHYARVPCLAEIARWGHFTSPDRPWERINIGMEEENGSPPTPCGQALTARD